jgi:hypothetical protein
LSQFFHVIIVLVCDFFNQRLSAKNLTKDQAIFF